MTKLAARALSLLLVALAIASSAQADTASGTRRTVVMASGRKLLVSRAWLVGTSYRLELLEGGVVTIPASLVKRVSNDSADLAGISDRPAVAMSSGGTGGDSYGGATLPDDPAPWTPPVADNSATDPSNSDPSAVTRPAFARTGLPGLRGASPATSQPNRGTPLLRPEMKPEPGKMGRYLGRATVGGGQGLSPVGLQDAPRR